MRVRISIVLAALAVTMLPCPAPPAPQRPLPRRAEDDRVVAYWTPARIANAKPKDYVRNRAGKIIRTPRRAAARHRRLVAQRRHREALRRILFSSGGSDWICSGKRRQRRLDQQRLLDRPDGRALRLRRHRGLVLQLPVHARTSTPNPATTATTRTRLLAARTCSPSTLTSSRKDSGSKRRCASTTASPASGSGSPAAAPPSSMPATGGYGLKPPPRRLHRDEVGVRVSGPGKYKGKDLMYCTGPTVDDPYDAPTWGMACNMTGGSSGGPWIYGTTNPADAGRTLTRSTRTATRGTDAQRAQLAERTASLSAIGRAELQEQRPELPVELLLALRWMKASRAAAWTAASPSSRSAARNSASIIAGVRSSVARSSARLSPP